MFYPFTAPAVRPSMILFWKAKIRTTRGIVTITDAADISPTEFMNAGKEGNRHRNGAEAVVDVKVSA
jgi:hypothetical protein